MMKSFSALVEEFNKTYQIVIRKNPQVDIPEEKLRLDLLREEFEEYREAVENKDLIEIADALGDIVYIAFGNALAYGIDLDAILLEIHRSNMSKLGSDGEPIFREDGKILKGPNYFKPDIANVLGLSNG